MTLSNPPRVFISYARSDGEAFAIDLRQRLEHEQPEITLWQDRARMEGGKDWWRQITDALDQVKFMVLVMTPDALASPVVRREWQYARQRGVCVYPVVGSPDLDFKAMPRWMADAHFYHLDKEWDTFVNYLKSKCVAPRLPFMAPDLPDGFVDRPGLLSPLLDALLDASHDNPVPSQAALYGPGGFGKTTLAAALCHRDEVIMAYDAGILWATLGERPNVLGELTKLYAALTGERPGFVDAQDAARALTERMGDGHYLLVVDDVWNRADMQPFLHGAPNCARLVTTRQFDIAAELDAPVAVDEMSSDEAVAMLAARLKQPPSDRRSFRQLAARLGEWPLLLELARDVLGKRVASGEGVEAALVYVNTALNKRGATAFDRRNAQARNDAVAKSLQVSLDLLTPDEQARYRELAIFPEDVSIPIAVAGALWGLDDFDADEQVTRLDDLSLVRLDRARGAFRLHDVVRAILVGQLPSADATALHARLVDAWGDLHALPNAYAWRWVGYHLLGAVRADGLRQLLFDFTWLRAKLAATHANALVADFALLENAPAHDETVAEINHELARAVRQAAHVLAQDPNQLASQLWGRLSVDQGSEILTLLEQICDVQRSIWLRPLTPSMKDSRALIRSFKSRPARAISISPNGDSVLIATNDGMFKSWNLGTGEELETWSLAAGRITAAVISPGERLAIVAIKGQPSPTLAYPERDGGALRILDTEHKQALLTFEAHEDVITAIALTQHDRKVVTASADHTLKVWDLNTIHTAQPNHILEGHTAIVRSIAITSDDRLVISASHDETVKVWDLQSGKCLNTLEGHTEAVWSVAITSDNGRALSASADGTIKIWDIRSGQLLYTLVGHTSRVSAVAIAPNGYLAVSGSHDNTMRVWNIHTYKAVCTIEGHTDSITAIAIASEPNGHLAVTASDDGKVYVWDLRADNPADAVERHPATILAVHVTSDGLRAITASTDGTLKEWDIESGRVHLTSEKYIGILTAFAITPDGHQAISVFTDNMLKVIDIKTGQLLRTLRGHSSEVTGVAVTGDGRLAVSGSADGTIKVWDIETEKELTTWLSGDEGVRTIAISLDGHSVFSASHDREHRTHREVTEWDMQAESPLPIRSSIGHTDTIRAICVTDNRRYVISASWDKTIKVWDTEIDQEFTLGQHELVVTGIATSPDGRLIVSASRDGVLKIWDLSSQELLTTLRVDGALQACAITPDGRTIVAGDNNGRVHFLRLENLESAAAQ